MEAPQKAKLHVVILPTPGMGHLIPLTELARKLTSYITTITFIIPNDGSNIEPQKALLESVPSINTIFLPPVNLDDLPEDTKSEARIGLVVTRSLTDIRQTLIELIKKSMTCRVSAFMVDTFGTFSFDAVKDLGIPLYIFFTSPAMLLSFTLHLPELEKSRTCEFGDLTEPVRLPGCVPIRASDLPEGIHDRQNHAYQMVLKMCNNYSLAKGILVNGFWDLEPNTYKAFEEDYNIPPVYPVGPLVRTATNDDKAECLKWLDKQPIESVLFVSFGSGGTLSTEQIRELALGLEMSGQRFLLVAKRPHEKVRNAAYFSSTEKSKTDPFEFLPNGFLERITKLEKGFLLSEWAPQIEVLSHPAVGGFVTHCGWNSMLESLVRGVPLIAWPLFAEQKMSAVLLSEDLKVAFRVRENENGVVDSEQIAKLVKSLFEGEEGMQLRNRMRNLKAAGVEALGQDGSSTKALAKVVEKWIANVQ